MLKATMYNGIYGNNAPTNLCNSIVMACEANDRNTRVNDTMKVDVPYCQSDVFKKSFIYRGSVAWNSLSDELHNANSIDSFKSNL